MEEHSTTEIDIETKVICPQCPYAVWTLWCPYSGTPICIKCPIYTHREKGTATYVFPRDTDMKVK